MIEFENKDSIEAKFVVAENYLAQQEHFREGFGLGVEFQRFVQALEIKQSFMMTVSIGNLDRVKKLLFNDASYDHSIIELVECSYYLIKVDFE